MRNFLMQIHVDEIQAENENEAMIKFLEMFVASNKLIVDIFDADSLEYVTTHAVIRGDTNDSGSIH